MSSNKNKDQEHEKQLEKRREKRRKVLEKEMPEEKEYRLAKRRAAYKRRSEACTGKDSEKKREENRVYMRERRRQGYARQRAERLAEGQQQQSGNPEVSQVNKSGEKDGPDHEEIERIVSFCEELASIIYSVPEEGEENVSDIEPQGVSKNEYLHEGGWQNADSPLHEQEFVQNEMHSFHLDQERLEHRQCTVCKEAWPTRAKLEHQKHIPATGARGTRNHQRNSVLRMTWTQELFLSS